MGQNRNQRLKKNCQWSTEQNGIYIEKSQMKTNTNTQTEENEVKVV